MRPDRATGEIACSAHNPSPPCATGSAAYFANPCPGLSSDPERSSSPHGNTCLETAPGPQRSPHKPPGDRTPAPSPRTVAWPCDSAGAKPDSQSLRGAGSETGCCRRAGRILRRRACTRPAYETVPGPQMARRRGPGKTGHRFGADTNQVLQVLSHRPGVPEIVMALHQGVEQHVIIRSPHLSELKVGTRLPQAVCATAGPLPVSPPVAGAPPHCSARSSSNIRPRHTISRSAPLACRQSQRSHSVCDSARRLCSGCSAINAWMNSMSRAVIPGPVGHLHFHAAHYSQIYNGTQVATSNLLQPQRATPATAVPHPSPQDPLPQQYLQLMGLKIAYSARPTPRPITKPTLRQPFMTQPNPWPSYTSILIALRARLRNTNSAPLNGSSAALPGITGPTIDPATKIRRLHRHQNPHLRCY